MSEQGPATHSANTTLNRLAEGMIAIPQRDGTVRRFPRSAGDEALANLMDRLGAGEDAPPEHLMIEVVRNASDPKWASTAYLVEDPKEWVKPIEDLSER
jgi:hypothetical protein